MNTRGLFTKHAWFVAHQRNYVDLHSFHMDVLLNPKVTNAPTSNVVYLLRKLFNVMCLVNVVLNLSIVVIVYVVILEHYKHAFNEKRLNTTDSDRKSYKKGLRPDSSLALVPIII